MLKYHLTKVTGWINIILGNAILLMLRNIKKNLKNYRELMLDFERNMHKLKLKRNEPNILTQKFFFIIIISNFLSFIFICLFDVGLELLFPRISSEHSNNNKVF